MRLFIYLYTTFSNLLFTSRAPISTVYTNSSYGFSISIRTYDTARLCSPSDFAIANYAQVGGSYTTPARQNGGTTYYWTSSAGVASYFAYLVDSSGRVSYNSVNYESRAARPALLFNL